MKKYVNGYREPKFIIKDIDNNLIENIVLDLTNEAGLIEENEFIYIKHNLLNGNTITKYDGFNINFTLNYDQYLSKTNTVKIDRLIYYILQNNIIDLQPRFEEYRRVFEVVYTGEPLTLGLLKGGLNSAGNYGYVLKFRTKYKQIELINYDPDTIKYTCSRINNRINIQQIS
jgi:hypothetical protein